MEPLAGHRGRCIRGRPVNRIVWTAARYEHAASLMASGVHVVAVGDVASARVDVATRRVLAAAREDTSGLWDNVLGATKALRWRLITQPQPLDFNMPLLQGALDVTEEASKVHGALGARSKQVLETLVDAVARIGDADPILGGHLLDSLSSTGVPNCVVLAANGSAAAGLESWLGPLGFAVSSVAQLIRSGRFYDQGFAVGPPRFFGAALVTAPMTKDLGYFVPDWFRDRSVPHSELAEGAAGAVVVSARTITLGESSTQSDISDTPTDEEQLLPQVVWATPDAAARSLGAEDVLARQVKLSGGFAMMLDDGERIRAVDPTQPGGARVTSVDIAAVRPGTYLLVREGLTERKALYDAALNLLGAQRELVESSQLQWKTGLAARLEERGRVLVVRELAAVGVQTLERVEAWIEPMLVRPRSDRDFQLLLQWLGIAIEPTFSLATDLRRKRAQATANITEQLEEGVGRADMSVLERDGHLFLELPTEGFRGMRAVRVLAVSPHVEVVSVHDVRILVKDRGAQWLE